MSIDVKQATEVPLTDGDLVWGSDSGETAVKVVTDVVGKAATQTLTNKTLTTPVIATISNSGDLTLPVGVDTLVARDTTDTLTNKTLTSPTINTATIATPSITTPTITNYSINTPQTLAASVTDAQAQAPITSEIVIVTATNADDVVTLPTPTAGRRCQIIQAPTSLRLKVYPSSGTALQGVGTDTAFFISAGYTASFVAISSTVWLRTDYTANYPSQTVALAAAAVTFNVLSPLAILTGDAGGNTLESITGGTVGQELTIIFQDALVDIDDGSSTDDTSLLGSVNFTTATADTVLKLIHDGTHWHEVARQIN